jgi:GNAT superfamily N-acetyltransferase
MTGKSEPPARHGVVIRSRPADLPALIQAAARCSPPLALEALPPHSWTLWLDGLPAGMVGLAPVPGLPGLMSLQGFVTPAWQRRGWGTRLLSHALHNAAVGGAAALTAAVSDLETSGGRFLSQRGFALEHEEVRLRLGNLAHAPAPTLPSDLAVRTYPAVQSVPAFLHLYAASFGPQIWYQPYTNENELMAEMEAAGTEPRDLLFLVRDEEPIGFAWLRPIDAATAEIEPFGLHPTVQGRGWGRQLLLVALDRLRQAGFVHAQIGAWAINGRALRLYASVGFEPFDRLLYLARRLDDGGAAETRAVGA